MITLTRLASDQGYIDPDDVRKALTPATRLVALTHASNVLGTVQPIEAIGKIVREAGALFLVDAAQSAGVVPIDLKATPIDLLAFPGHKALYGPTGTGALYVGPRAKPRAWREGGTGGDSKSELQPEMMPYILEGGTPNVLGVAGLAAGVAWVAEKGIETNRKHEVDLLQKVVDWAEASSDGWKVAGRWDPEHPRRRPLADPARPRRLPEPGPRRSRSTPASGSPSGPGCTARPMPTRPSGPSPTAPSGSAPARSTRPRRSTGSSAPSRRSPPASSKHSDTVLLDLFPVGWVSTQLYTGELGRDPAYEEKQSKPGPGV